MFLKLFNTIDGKQTSKIYYKCNHCFCGFETPSQLYIEKHVEKHKISKRMLRKSQINYKTFCHLLEELKNGKIDSFIDPDNGLVLGIHKIET